MTRLDEILPEPTTRPKNGATDSQCSSVGIVFYTPLEVRKERVDTETLLRELNLGRQIKSRVWVKTEQRIANIVKEYEKRNKRLDRWPFASYPSQYTILIESRSKLLL